MLKQKIDSVQEGMQAAHRLHRQLEDKDKKMGRLNQIIAEQHREYENLQTNQSKLMKELDSQKENLVELPLIKNLVVQYVQLANGKPEQKEPLLRVMSTVLKFDAREFEQILEVAGCNRGKGLMGWISRGHGLNSRGRGGVSIGATVVELQECGGI